jgi:hypothetical protein
MNSSAGKVQKNLLGAQDASYPKRIHLATFPLQY